MYKMSFQIFCTVKKNRRKKDTLSYIIKELEEFLSRDYGSVLEKIIAH